MRARPGHLGLAGYRLPTEAEWEYACRAGMEAARPYGRSVELMTRYGWSLRNSGNRAHPVGRLKPNGLGLFDTLGNVMEWVDDPPRPADPCRAVDVEPPGRPAYTGPADRHPRGGAFTSPPGLLRSGCRFLNPGDYRQGVVGFRLARTVTRP
jgi:formylglycine-generating enzyme required for sulfatase activity